MNSCQNAIRRSLFKTMILPYVVTGGKISRASLTAVSFPRLPIKPRVYSYSTSRSTALEADNPNQKAQLYARTHTCGQLSEEHVGEDVRLCGWIQSIRQLSTDLLFLVIRDATGVTQLIAKQGDMDDRQAIGRLKKESVVSVAGTVQRRPETTIKKEIQTGAIEVQLQSIKILNNAVDPLPFYPSETGAVSEEVRSKHRYLDLRRDELQKNLRLRSHIALQMRNLLAREGFVEVETPMLFKSTPEGAREFLVPTRNKGTFYALPQSPQQSKQLLMVGGIDKYYQIARCFRDEDLRADRQPEFTQLDFEMSFVTDKDVMSLCERLMCDIFASATGQQFNQPFARLTYHDAMDRFGSDKPDLRFDLELQSFRTTAGHDQVVQALILPAFEGLSKSSLARLIKNVQEQFGVADSTITMTKMTESNISTIASDHPHLSLVHHAENLISKLQLEPGKVLFTSTVQYPYNGGSTLMGNLRVALAQVLHQRGLMNIPQDVYAFTWITSFPLFTRDDDGQLMSTHHPFTCPAEEDVDMLFSNPEAIRAEHYDLVLNGMEIGGGSIRIHDAELQMAIMRDILRLDDQQLAKFDHLIQALRSGAPPHGGFAFGFDRLMAILCKASSIRDVIAFPKAASGRDPVVGSPSPVSDAVLQDYGIRRVRL